ncbi:permease [Psychromonas marina]|uniref:Permease n=1 Tax=Psychromonas marina TaxID=88364 RepID=A0ABQ6E2U8_9GAMM|nr:DMT family transporter [Psychromonas marina]GLS91762.1 permease [Psychromonas marina]
MTPNRRADLILILATLLASAGWVFSKESIQGLAPFQFVGLRFVLAALCLLPFCYADIKALSKSNLLKTLGVGCLLASSQLLWIYAISVSDGLSEGAFIMSLAMLFVPLVGWPLFKIAPPRIFWLSLPIAIVGLMLLSLSNGWQQSTSQVWFILSAVMLAIHFNFNSRSAQKISPLSLTCIQLFVTGFIGLSISINTEVWPQQVSSDIWIWFAMSVLIATSLRYLMQTLGQKHSVAANAAIIMVLEPIWTVILSIMWYDEPMPLNKILGCLLIFSSLLIYRRGTTINNLKVIKK